MGGKGVWNSEYVGGGAFWNFRMHGGGKISMPPVVGVRIFSGTTHLGQFHVREVCIIQLNLILSAPNTICKLYQLFSHKQVGRVFFILEKLLCTIRKRQKNRKGTVTIMLQSVMSICFLFLCRMCF